MIQRINSTQLSSAKPRCGLQSVATLIPRLIEHYEMQANARKRMEQPTPAFPKTEPETTQQATFAFYQ